MEIKREYRVRIGISSMLVLMVAFILTAIAAGCVRASYDELLRAKKKRESVQNYYEADTQAEHLLKQIALVLDNYYNDKSGIALKVQLQDIVEGIGTVEAVTDKKGVIRYEITLGGADTLMVEVAYNMEDEEGQYYSVIKWSSTKKENGSVGTHI